MTKRCMDCGMYAEVRYVPGYVREDGQVFVGEPPKGVRIKAKTQVRRIFCGCNGGKGRHP
jgi:hypothetical protein